MNTTIKKRIEEINSGRVPEGYEKTSFGIYPCDWEKVSLGEVSAKKGEYGLNAPACEYKEGLPKYLRITDIDDQGRYIDNNACVNDADSRKYVLNKGDIVFARTGASVGKNYIYDEKDGILVYAGFLIKFSIKPQYNAYLICSNCRTKKYDNWVAKMCARSGQPGINAEEYATYSFIIPKSAQEQSRIAEILMQWDKAIELQEKYIKQLELRQKALMQRLLTPKEGWETKNLYDICKIETGKLDVNAMVEDGEYPFFTCSKQVYKIDKYAYDCEALLMAGNGDIGDIKYYNGKFNAYQRTYVLHNFGCDIKYVMYFLQQNFDRAVMRGTQRSSMPFIKLELLKETIIKISKNKDFIVKILSQADNEISLQTQNLDKLIKQRKALQQYLLTGIVRV